MTSFRAVCLVCVCVCFAACVDADSSPVPRGAAPAATPQVALEHLVSTVPCADVPRFIEADHRVWTAFLYAQAAFGEKQSMTAWTGAAPSAGMCEVWSRIRWQSREGWKAIPGALLGKVQAEFVEAFGSNPPLASVPSPQGLNVALQVLPAVSPAENDTTSALLEGRVASVPCGDVDLFVRAYQGSYGGFLPAVQGFVRSVVSTAPGCTCAPAAPAGNCSVWAETHWADAAAWQPQSAAWQRVQRDFEAVLGYAPATQPVANASAGLTVRVDTRKVVASR